MAHMYPSPIGPTKSPAERHLYDLLATQLNDDYIVFHDVAWLTKGRDRHVSDGQADFVVAHPDLGVCVIEVKGGTIHRDGRSGIWTSIDRHGESHSIRDPFEQAKRCMYSLRDTLEATPEWPSQRVRFVRAVVFPDAAYGRRQVPEGPHEIVIDVADLDRLDERLREIVAWWTSSTNEELGAGLTPTAMETLTAILARSFAIASPLVVEVNQDEQTFVQLSEQQFALSDFMRLQRRALISGVAAAGKTMLSAEHARRLARQGLKVLVLCSDRGLANHLATTIGRTAGLDVETFDGLQLRLMREAGISSPQPEGRAWGKTNLPAILMRAVEAVRERYDALVVDEAEDILSVWWNPLLALLRGDQDEIVYVLGDDNQDLGDIGDADELGIVMPVEIPRFEMTQSRRTTKSIHAFACRFYQTPTGSVTPVPLGPPGRRVVVKEYADVDQTMPAMAMHEPSRQCRKQLGKVLHEIVIKGKVPSDEVVVLTPRADDSWLGGQGSSRWAGAFELVPALSPDGVPAATPVKQTQVRLATISSFKGLELTVVVLAEIDGRIPRDRFGTTVYIGATRARSHLAVVADHQSAALFRDDPPD